MLNLDSERLKSTSVKGKRFHQDSLCSNLASVDAGQSHLIKAVLILLIALLNFLTGFFISFYGALTSLGFLVGSEEVRLSYLLLSLLIASWLFTAISQSIQKNSIFLLINFILIITVAQLITILFPGRFQEFFWMTVLLDAMLPLTIVIIGFFLIRISVALIDILWCKPNIRIVRTFGMFTFSAAVIIGVYLHLSVIAVRQPELEKILTIHMKTLVFLVGILVSYTVFFSAKFSNYIRNTPWQDSGLLRLLVLTIGCWKSTSFYDLDLSQVDFRNANLISTDLRARKLYRTCFQGVKGLERARVDSRYLDLELSKVQKLLVHGSSGEKDFNRLNLRGAYLQGADLRQFNFIGTELTGAYLEEADLRGAILVHAQVMGVDFTGANLTGACIENWSINSETCFTNVQCDYIYRRLDKNGESTDRYPVGHNFEPREFESLYQEVGNVVELIFKEGVNWRAFSFGLQKLQLEDDGLGLELKGFERRGDLWVVKVTHNENISKREVEHRLLDMYEEMKRLLVTKEQQINQLLGIATDQADALKEISRKPFGNSFVITDSTITNLVGSGQINYTEAADQIRNIIASSVDPNQVIPILRSFITQLDGQKVATTPSTQQELIQQLILSEAETDPVFKQFLLQQGQQVISAMPNQAIADAIQLAIVQLER